jgi:hypothetical protein
VLWHLRPQGPRSPRGPTPPLALPPLHPAPQTPKGITSFILKDAADRGRLGASTFKLLNLGLAATLTQQVGGGDGRGSGGQAVLRPAGVCASPAALPAAACPASRPQCSCTHSQTPPRPPQAWFIWTMQGAGVALNHNLWVFMLAKTAVVAGACAAAWATAKK